MEHKEAIQTDCIHFQLYEYSDLNDKSRNYNIRTKYKNKAGDESHTSF